MKVIKFGGASVKDANGVKNLLKILHEIDYNNMVLVISAMGKMTNAFEQLVDVCFARKEANIINEKLNFINHFHSHIISELFYDKNQPIFKDFDILFDQLKNLLKQINLDDYDFVYDQIVCYGELFSTKICSAYLITNGIQNKWIDIRENIKTDSSYRQAKVDWDLTCSQLNKNMDWNGLTITQGFIAGDTNNFTTTLGREGSDYSAAIIAYCLQADEVQIYKDVPGVLNADPKVFKNTQLLNHISYREAIEMAFYGASVIHPKTLQPLQRKNIPLKVKSFKEPNNKGTSVKHGTQINPKIPCFIVKHKQILLSISDRDFHFVMENDISEIFYNFHRNKMKVNVIQNSAISLSVCIEDKFNNFDTLLQNLQSKYKILYNKNLTLYTIRHFDQTSIFQIEKEKEVLLKQLSRETAQILVKS